MIEKNSPTVYFHKIMKLIKLEHLGLIYIYYITFYHVTLLQIFTIIRYKSKEQTIFDKFCESTNFYVRDNFADV